MKSLPACLLLTSMIWMATAAESSAQGIQDLFARPQSPEPIRSLSLPGGEIDRKVPSNQSAPLNQPAWNRRGDVSPVQPDADPSFGVPSPSDRALVNGSGSAEAQRLAIAMDIRQARALDAARQREARLEVGRWAGNPSLRPAWNPDPFHASRFQNMHRFIVPAYVW